MDLVTRFVPATPSVQRRGRDSLLVVAVGSTNGTRVVDDGVEHVLGRGRRACVVGLDARLVVAGWCYRVALPRRDPTI